MKKINKINFKWYSSNKIKQFLCMLMLVFFELKSMIVQLKRKNRLTFLIRRFKQTKQQTYTTF